jgi:hypothetical protein
MYAKLKKMYEKQKTKKYQKQNKNKKIKKLQMSLLCHRIVQSYRKK